MSADKRNNQHGLNEKDFHRFQLNISQLNSLQTLADLALNCSNNDRDHSYSVDSKKLNASSTDAVDKECLVQKEKDHTYASSGRTKNIFHNKTLTKQIPRRSSSVENVSRNFDTEIYTPLEKNLRINTKKSQSYEEILGLSDEQSRKEGRHSESCYDTSPSESTVSSSSAPHIFDWPSVRHKHLKVTGDLTSAFLPPKDHTYAVVNDEHYDVEMICDTKRKISQALNIKNRSYDDHIYNKINADNSYSNVIKTMDIPIWSRKSDHSYFSFDQTMRNQVLENSKPGSILKSSPETDVIQHSSKRDRLGSRSDHTYFTLA